MRKTRRTLQVGDVVRETLSTILLRDITEPDLAMVSVTEVEVTTDLRQARVYVSVIGDESRRERAMKALDGNRGRIRRELGSRARLRYTPSLEFVLDTTAEHAMRIEALLRDVIPEKEKDDDADGIDD